jgi:hypothetical protein
MFEFPCIIALYYTKNQQDATLAVLFISHCKILFNTPITHLNIRRCIFWVTDSVIGWNIKEYSCSEILQRDRQTDGRTDRRTDRQTDGRTQTDGQTDRQTDRLTDRQTGRVRDRQTDGRTDGRTDRRTDRRTGRQTVFLPARSDIWGSDGGEWIRFLVKDAVRSGKWITNFRCVCLVEKGCF